MNSNRILLSGCAIFNHKKELLLLFKTKRQHYEFTGGGVEGRETIEQAARREVREEVGCEVDFLDDKPNYEYFEIVDEDDKSIVRKFRAHLFLSKLKNNCQPQIMEPGEFDHLMWMPITDYKKYNCAPNVVEFCENIIAGKIKVEI